MFFFAREALVDHERHFGAVQTHAFGAPLLRTGYVGQQTGVDPQRHAMPVQRHARQFAQGIETLSQLPLFFDHLGVLLAHDVAGVGEDLTVIAIDDQFDAVDLGVRQVDYAHDRGNTHGPRQNRHVGVAGTEHRDQADQLAFRHFAEHRR